MALTFAQLQELVKKENIHYFIAPDRPVVRFGIGGMFGQYEIVISLQDDGKFIQFRTVGYLNCLANNANLNAVLQTLATINFTKRLVKYAWDSSDGEIVAYADLWVMDNQVTQEQFSRIMSNFIPGIDVAYRRIRGALESGKDPGDQDAQTAAAAVSGGETPTMPPQLKELLDKLEKKKGEKPQADRSTTEKPEIKEI